jgi:hypothetical protein
LPQQLDIPTVIVIKLITGVKAELQIAAETAHRAVMDTPPSGKTFRRVGTETAILQLLEAVAGFVEGQGMQVYPVVLVVAQVEPGRHLIFVDPVAKAGERCDHGVGLGEHDGEVEVLVLPCLPAEQRVNSPAAIEPDLQALGLEQVNYPHYLARGHHDRLSETRDALPADAASGALVTATPKGAAMADNGLTSGSEAGAWPEIDTSVAHVARVYNYPWAAGAPRGPSAAGLLVEAIC